MAGLRINKQRRGHGLVPGWPRLLGGALCLDFVNTVEGRMSHAPEDFLTDDAALVRWGQHVGLLSEGASERQMPSAHQHPGEAVQVFHQAVALRDAVYRIFLGVSQHQLPDPKDLNVLQSIYTEGLRHAELRAEGTVCRWVWPADDELEGVNWVVARSAVELLTSREAGRVKQCPGCGDCGWLFLDASKGGTRQWCSMEGCGSRAKMRRQYQRQHGKAAEPSSA